MNTTLHLIADVSGSMNEMGKIHLQGNLCRFATQLKIIDREKYKDISISLYKWTHNITDMKIQSDGTIPILAAEGSSNLNALSDFISRNTMNQESHRILILSDGKFERNDYDSFINRKNEHEGFVIRTVAVGADADLLKLRNLSSNGSVYLAENIAAAIDCSIFENDDCVIFPDDTDFDLISESVKPNGVRDA